MHCCSPKGRQLHWDKSLARRGTEQATEPLPWDRAFLGFYPFSAALSAITLYWRNHKKKKSVCCRRREGRSSKGTSPLSPHPDKRTSAPELQYFPPLGFAGQGPPVLELPVDARVVLAFPVQPGYLTHASSQPQTPLLCSRREPNDVGFSGHFLTTFYLFCSSLQAKH